MDIYDRGDNNNNITDNTSSNLVVNVSSCPLMEAQLSFLASKPKFTVVPRHPPKGEYTASVEEVCLHLSLE